MPYDKNLMPDVARGLSLPAPRSFSSRQGGAGFGQVLAQQGAVPDDAEAAGARALAAMAQVLEGQGGGIGSNGAMAARSLLALTGKMRLAGEGGMGDAISEATRTAQGKRTAAAQRSARASRSGGSGDVSGLGSLAAQFESGDEGIAAIGYDRHGGTSYGKFQIASRPGTMDRFLDYLDGQAPDIASRLREAGPANTGSRNGAMPDAWRAIADEQPARFEALQDRFITESHYVPALDAVSKQAGLDKGAFSPALKEVLWSTAVQHGPGAAARIFNRAVDLAGDGKGSQHERELIRNVYAVRSEQFGSSTSRVREAVQQRLQREMQLALNMVGKGPDRA
ncbi:chitosanase [Nitratidesulfovibrio vulgaris]|uniref:chitosanase n=1 Tax=Nitratidesulfovibrio vulgaris TaxID=881 RepID=UPI0013DEB3EF|nr:chitosanase [Nitratidesulfovibrio vulgaris]